MKKLNIIISLIIFINCQNTSIESITLTSGLSQNPDEPRFGIEISNRNIYYCEEKIENKGTYNYFQCEVNPEIFDDLKYRISSTFKSTNESEDIVDATRYQLVYTVYNKSDTIRFYKQHLDDEQKKVIEKIISLKINKFRSIKYHSFPNELLTYKLPTPPPF